MLNGKPCKTCLNKFKCMLFLAIDINSPNFLDLWENWDKRKTNPFNIVELLNIISHFLPRNGNLERLKKSERLRVDFDAIVLPRHTMNRFIIDSINRFTMITERSTTPSERKEFNKQINSICFNCHCDNCMNKCRDKLMSYVDFKPIIESGMRYIRFILIKMIITVLTETIQKIGGYDSLTCSVEIIAYEQVRKELIGWIKTHLEISYNNKEFMLMCEGIDKHPDSVTLQEFYNRIYEIPIQLTGIVPREHYQEFHNGYITDVIAGHPLASNGWMREAMDDMEEMGVFS